MSDKKIEYWFKLTYDADAKTRLKAAKELSTCPASPMAVFAIYELTYDKDDKVKTLAKKIINSWRDDKAEIIPFGEILAEKMEKGKKIQDEDEDERIAELKKRLMPSLEKYFKSDDSRKKLMPSLEKLFERLARVELKGHKTFKRKEVKESQESLFEEEEDIEMPPEYKDYLTTLSEIDRIIFTPTKTGGKQKIKIKKTQIAEDDIEEMLEEVEEEAEEEDDKIPTEDAFERIIYKKAYKLHVAPGLTQALINKEMKRTIQEYSLKIKSAFSLAKLRSTRNEVDKISDLEQGMKNIYTAEFKVEEIEQKEVRRGTRTTDYLKLIVSDKTGKFPVFIWKGRGRGIYENDYIKLECAFVDEYPEIGEIALSIDKKGKIIVIK